VRVRYTDPAKKREFLDAQVRFETLAAEAFTRGFDKDPEVVEATKKIIVQKLTREEFDNRVKMQDVSDDDLKKYFDTHTADYQKPAMVRTSDLAIAFGSDKAAAKKKAEDAQKKAASEKVMKDPNAFKDLVTQLSTDEGTKRAGGDLRYLSDKEVEDKLGPAAKTWLFGGDTIGEVSPVIEGKDAFHVLKRTGKRKEIERTFEQVKNQIKNVVFREKRTDAFNKYVDDLEKKHDVTVYGDKLDEVKVNAQMPPGMDPHAALGGMVPPPPPGEEAAERADHPSEPKIDPNDTGGEGKP
ncbi:MAG TPA: peptidyl-prolyl cis-trans isomerase, partial [Myxococcota bacterium]